METNIYTDPIACHLRWCSQPLVLGARNPPHQFTLPAKPERERRERQGKPRPLRIGGLNVRGCNQCEKKCETGDLFVERNLDVLVLSETKLKGKEEVMFGKVRGRVSGVSERVRAKEGVAILLSEGMWECVNDWREVSARLMWVRMTVGQERWVIVGAYGPGSERSAEERERFWEEICECVAGFDEREWVMVVGDLNARVGDREIEGVTGKFGVPGLNENGEWLLNMCAERGLVVGNTWFNKRKIHKYTWVSGVDGRNALIDYTG